MEPGGPAPELPGREDGPPDRPRCGPCGWAIDHGACLRPIQLRRTDPTPARWTRSWCPAGRPWPGCARPARNGPRTCAPPNAGKGGTSIRAHPGPLAPDEVQTMLIEHRAQAQADRDHAARSGRRHGRTGRADHRPGHRNQALRAARQRRPRHPPAAPSPVHPPPPRRPRPAQAGRSARTRSARPTPHRTARRSGRRCSSP